MAKKEKEYTRLPGRGRKRGSFITVARTSATLWAGRDHLLSVHNSVYAEDYKRFYYRDIQAVVTRKTGRAAAWSVVFGFIAALFALIGFFVEGFVSSFFGTVAGLFLLALVINILRGPACICHLITAVTKEELPSLKRLKTARKAVEIIRRRVEAAQGSLSQEEIAANFSGAAAPRLAAGVPRSPSLRPGAAYTGKAHVLLFSALLLNGAVGSLDLFVSSMAVTLAGLAVMIAVTVAVIVSATRQQGSRVPQGLRGLTWGALAYVCLSYISGYAFSLSMAIKNPSLMSDQAALLKAISELSPFENPVLMVLFLFSIVSSFSLGIPGLVLAKTFRNQTAAVPAFVQQAGRPETGGQGQ